MKNFKKVMALALSAAMALSMSTSVLADAPASTDPAAGTTGGTGNILDHSVETVVVPTALKIALNPNGYTINTKYTLATAFDEDAVYYTESNGTYSIAEVDEDDFPEENDTYYVPTTSTSKIVSLNYGIANKSTDAKRVTIEFNASYTASAEAEENQKIVLVDEIAKAQAYNETSNAGGAKPGEYKMYLEMVSSKAVPTADTYAKATSFAANTKYYTKGNDGTFTKLADDAQPADADAFKAGTYYLPTTTIGPEITAKQLSDVTIAQLATKGNTAFERTSDTAAKATMAYKLEKATYALKDGEFIDFGTTQEALASDKLELSAIGGVAAFTITGEINPNADWTKAETDAITITPQYKVEDVDNEEEAIDAANAYNQIKAVAAPSIATTNFTMTADEDFVINLNLGSGDKAATGVSSFVWTGNNKNMLGTQAIYDATAKTITIDAATVNYLITNASVSTEFTLKFSDTNETTKTVTLVRPS